MLKYNHHDTAKPDSQQMPDDPPSPSQTTRLLLNTIRQLAAELHPESQRLEQINLNSSLDKDAGLDSIARAELILRLERTFSIHLPEHLLMGAESPRELLKFILRADKKPTDDPAIMAKDSYRLAMPVRAERAPEQADTLVDVLHWHAQNHPTRPHILYYGDGNTDARYAIPQAITYQDLLTGAQKIACGLQRLGIRPGQTVAIMLPTSEQYFFCFLGVLLTGAIPVPVYPPANLYQLEDHITRHTGIFQNAQAVALITVPTALKIGHLLKSRITSLQHLQTPEDLISNQSRPYPVSVKAGDIALLQYTSGSTGQPKGVIMTHTNLLANMNAMGDAAHLQPSDIFVSWLPLYHDMGLIGAWLDCLYYAIPLVLMSPLAFLTRPDRWLWAISQHRATLSGAPNFAYELCLAKIRDEDIKGLDLSSLRFLFNGAEPVNPHTVHHFIKRFSGYGLSAGSMAPVYGLAEAGLALTFPPPGRRVISEKIKREDFSTRGLAVPEEQDAPGALEFIACGQPLPGYQVRIVDSHNRELPDRQQGQLQFSGPSMTRGYYRNPEATAKLVKGEWLDSGDLAYIADGDVYLTGRLKDVIIKGGRNIFPQEIEDVVNRIAGIRKGCVAAFGVADSNAGTEKLIIVAETRRSDDKGANDKVRASLQQNIISVTTDLLGMPPDDVVVAPAHTLLKTSSGKIRRSSAKAQYTEGQIKRRPRAAWRQLTRLWLANYRSAPGNFWRGIRKLTYAGYVISLFWLTAPVVWLSVVCMPKRNQARTIARYASQWFLRFAGYPLKIDGIEHLAAQRPCIVVANHASYLDVVVMAATLPPDFGFVAKGELKNKLISRLFLKKYGTLFVERFNRQRSITDAKKTTLALKGGDSLVYFPEGTFTRAPGLLPFHMGAFAAAAQAGVPVVPVIIRGNRSILRSDSWFPNRGRIRVLISPCIFPVGNNWNAAIKLSQQARKAILRHLGEPDLGHQSFAIKSAS